MNFVTKMLIVLLVALTFIVPIIPAGHCDGDQDAECDCVCCCKPVFACVEQLSDPKTNRIDGAAPTDLLLRGRLFSADIFRPPTFA